MKGGKQKISQGTCHQETRAEPEGTDGGQTFKWITENNLTNANRPEYGLLEQILSPSNLNRAYKRVRSNCSQKPNKCLIIPLFVILLRWGNCIAKLSQLAAWLKYIHDSMTFSSTIRETSTPDYFTLFPVGEECSTQYDWNFHTYIGIFI